ncbi:MAG: Flp family type IVb pilin [Methylocella sp.]|nr:MAG: Flp family type IVb pilin [Hyphomicrobiales bacterium]
MMTLFIRFARDESGVTAIEYGMVAALIVIGIISVVRSIGTTLAANFFGPIASGFS